MPLTHSSSPSAFKSNVKTLMGEIGKSPHVQSRDQALAISYAIKRRGKAEGGGVEEPLRQAGLGLLKQEMKGPRANLNSAMQGLVAEDISDNVPRIRRSTPYGLKGGRYIKTGGAVGRADGGRVHVGAIMSAVPGRTDLHPMSVKAGSYVFPADHISHLGQNNTIAGLDKLNKMFSMGPYGTAAPHIKHGRSGLPRPPHLMKTSTGGVAGDGVGDPTPINAAGGEFVVPPEKILEWMHNNGFKPDLDAAHKEFDKWVVDTRKEHHKTLSKLPGPAKS